VRVTVFGSARLTEESSEYQEAMRLGRILASRGDTIVSGGYGGLMEAVSRGAAEAKGSVVGITMAPWAGRLTPNQYLSEERAAETLFARIEGLIESDCLIALTGGAGTLGEVALAWNLGQMNLIPHKHVILVGPAWQAMVTAFRQHLVVEDRDLALLTVVKTIDEAVSALDDAGDRAATSWRG
jgi:uncharacterized protein (TIGR00730 family)